VAFAAAAAALKCLAGPGVLGAPRRSALERALARGIGGPSRRPAQQAATASRMAA